MSDNKQSVHVLCVAATVAMVKAGGARHISYIHPEEVMGEDTILDNGFQTGKIPKITIEWVDPAEAISSHK